MGNKLRKQKSFTQNPCSSSPAGSSPTNCSSGSNENDSNHTPVFLARRGSRNCSNTASLASTDVDQPAHCSPRQRYMCGNACA